MVIEILALVLAAGLVIVITTMAIIGLLGMLGVVGFVRCDHCRHLGVTTLSSPLRTCTYCRHGRLMHPIYTVHHAHFFHQEDSEPADRVP
ncbi:MAG: hypothetical protein ACRD0Z_09410 [Acidimicrobiales bacterium]